MYSLMSMRTSACSSSKRNSANARASSVLPTPVGPRKINDPMGRLGSFSPARARTTASATADTASSCPITRLCSSSSRWLSFWTSPSISRATGTPVHRDTTAAISSSSTSSLIRRSPPAFLSKASSSAARLFDFELGLFDFGLGLGQLFQSGLLLTPLRLQRVVALADLGQFLLQALQAILGSRIGFTLERLALDLELHDAPVDFVKLRRHRLLF